MMSTDEKVEIIEGSAKMLYNKNEQVFYNKVQVLNRDLSIHLIRLYSEVLSQEINFKQKSKTGDYTKPSGLKILDALAASGLRSIRYLKEIPLVRSLIINDISLEANQLALENCQLNEVDMSKVSITNRDATMIMYENRDHKNQFDVIDLDPYGTAAPFIDGAVQAITDGGLLCVTCTDMTVLCGTYPEVTFSKYGSMPNKGSYKHEMALRILLHSIESAANKYKRHIVPWVSLSVDYYVRVFVRVFQSPAEVKNSCLKRVMLYQSTQCPLFYIQPLAERTLYATTQETQSDKNGIETENSSSHDHLIQSNITSLPISQIEMIANQSMNRYLIEPPPSGKNYHNDFIRVPSQCPETDGKFRIGGPYWGCALHHQAVVDELLRRLYDSEIGSNEMPFVLSTAPRLKGILSSISDELKDIPFYYSLPELSSMVASEVPTKLQIEAALVNGGYRVSSFHDDEYSIKTDAPALFVWDMMRSYCKINPPKLSKKRAPSKTSQSILSKEITYKNINFTATENLRKKHQEKKNVARFPPNPEAFWGPKARAGRKAKQNKNKDLLSVDELSHIDSSIGDNIQSDRPGKRIKG